MRVAVILGSTRDGRNGERVARWVVNQAKEQTDWEVELLDLAGFNLPMFNEATLPAMMGGKYPEESVQEWSRRVAAADAFIFLTAEYNHGLPAPLKNALDWLHPEWADKAAGIVSYSGSGGAGIRAAEQLRTVLAFLGVATVRMATAVAHVTDSVTEDGNVASEALTKTLATTLRQVDQWGGALTALRSAAEEKVAA